MNGIGNPFLDFLGAPAAARGQAAEYVAAETPEPIANFRRNFRGAQVARGMDPSPPPMAMPPLSRDDGPSDLDAISSFLRTLDEGRKAKKEEEPNEWDKVVEDLRRHDREQAMIAAQAGPQAKYEPGTPAGMEGYFAKNRQAESGGDDGAVNSSTGATGRYQFLPSTWRGIMKEAPELGLTENGMTDPAQQEAAMRYYTQKSVNQLRGITGRDPTGGELYALHLFGHGGGSNLVSNPEATLASMFPEVVFSSNPWLRQYKTGSDLLNYLNRRFA